MANDRLTKLLERSAQLQAQIKDAKAQVKEKERRKDRRMKIIAGANALLIASRNPGFRAELAELMNRTVKRPEDRAMYEFLQDMTPPAPAASEGFAAAADPLNPKDD